MTAVQVMEPQVVEEVVEELEAEQPEPAEAELPLAEAETADEEETLLEDSPPDGVDPLTWQMARRLVELGWTLEDLIRQRSWTEVCHVNANLTLNGILFTVTKCDQKQATLKTFTSRRWVDEVRVGGRYEVQGHWFMVTTMGYDPEGKNNVITIVTTVAPPEERRGWFQIPLDEAEEQEAPIAPAILRDLLLLVARDVPLVDIEAWTDEQREQAAEWAAAYHNAANDNDDVVVPEMPAVLIEAKAKHDAAVQLARELGHDIEDLETSEVYAGFAERGYRWQPEAGEWALVEQPVLSPEMEMAAMTEDAE